MTPEFFLVGGAVRDKLMGLNPKDFDFTVTADSFEAMEEAIIARGGKIFLSKPEFFTTRAKSTFQGNVVDADFVLARKESGFTDGRHPDKVEMGTIQDDLARRDFTMNAIAIAEDGAVIDPFGGQADIANALIRAVGNAEARFAEDRLRVLRAIRFAVTKGFSLDTDIWGAIREDASLRGVSPERIREEMNKMLKVDAQLTFNWLSLFPTLFREILKAVGFESTLKPKFLP